MSDPSDEFLKANRALQAKQAAQGRRVERARPSHLRLVMPPLEVIAEAEAELAAELQASQAAHDARQAERTMKRRRELLETSGLRLRPEAVAMLIRGKEWETETLAKVRAWVSTVRHPDAKRLLVLLGSTGTGKTMAAAWALLKLGGGLGVKARKLPGLEMAHFGPQAEHYQRLVKGKLCVVDEIGTMDAKKEASSLGELIDDRIGRPTILIGNLPPKNEDKTGFLQRYHERFYSRLAEVGVVVDCTGPDLRIVGKPALARPETGGPR